MISSRLCSFDVRICFSLLNHLYVSVSSSVDLSQCISSLVCGQEFEVLSAAQYTNTHIIFGQLSLLSTCLESLQSMLNEIVSSKSLELLKVSLKVCLC